MPDFYMLIGVPGVGKSTWCNQQNIDNVFVYSTDDYIETQAKDLGKTYNQVFEDYIKKATFRMNALLDVAVKNGSNVIWDQTNLTSRSRKRKLNKIPKDYKKIAVVFSIPDDLEQRLNSRPGKTIPPAVLKNMINSFQYPDESEGWNEIVYI